MMSEKERCRKAALGLELVFAAQFIYFVTLFFSDADMVGGILLLLTTGLGLWVARETHWSLKLAFALSLVWAVGVIMNAMISDFALIQMPLWALAGIQLGLISLPQSAVQVLTIYGAAGLLRDAGFPKRAKAMSIFWKILLGCTVLSALLMQLTSATVGGAMASILFVLVLVLGVAGFALIPAYLVFLWLGWGSLSREYKRLREEEADG